MEKVQGIGGFFFRARDPQGLAEWYETHLGVSKAPADMDTRPWVSKEGVTVFAPFAEDTGYFSADKRFMLNFRVADMDAMLAQLHVADIATFNEQTMDGIGRFAHLHDPEGNPIELWEPPA